MKCYPTLLSLLALIAVGSALGWVAGEALVLGHTDPQTARGPLSMSLSVTTPHNPQGNPVFHITLENIAEDDVMVNLGKMLANGRIHLPDAIRLTLTDPQGQSRELHFSDRKYPGVAGRIDDYVVPLRAGSTYTIPLDLDGFWCPQTKGFRLRLKPGEYRVRAQLTGKGVHYVNGDTEGMKRMNYWTGKVQSDEVTFRLEEQG